MQPIHNKPFAQLLREVDDKLDRIEKEKMGKIQNEQGTTPAH